MFSLFMGLSNFGSNTAEYVGAGLIELYGGVEAPEFDNLTAVITVSCFCKALPIVLVPFLVPKGTPMGTAREMGAGEAVTGRLIEESMTPDGNGNGNGNGGNGKGGGRGGGGGNEVSYAMADLQDVDHDASQETNGLELSRSRSVMRRGSSGTFEVMASIREDEPADPPSSEAASMSKV